MRKSVYIIAFSLSSCTSQFLAQKEETSLSTLESLHELRQEVAELVHTLHGQSVDIQLLEEKVSNLSLKKRELLSENLEMMQQKVNLLESTLASTRMHLEQSKKQQQQVFDGQLQRLSSLENKVSQHETSLHIIKDLKGMMSQLKSPTQAYAVSSGDTLEGISRKFGVRIGELKALNQLSSDQIQVGQTLKIPL